MAYVSVTKKMEQHERIRKNMRSLLFSNDAVNELLGTTQGKTLEFIDGFLEREMQRRADNRKAAILKRAGFPSLKSLDDFDFSEVKMPPSMEAETMISLDFIKNKDWLIMYGPCGTGKTMLSTALGLKACNMGMNVKFFTLSQLAYRLKEAASEERMESMLSSLRKLDLLIIDEWGYCQLDREASGYVYNVIAESYEKKSLIVTTNLPFSEWGKIVADDQLAAAIIDRIVHHGHFIDLGKKDWRLAHSPMNRAFQEAKR